MVLFLINIIHFPSDSNPYQKLIFESLQKFGIFCESIDKLGCAQISVIKNSDILHIHWIDLIIRFKRLPANVYFSLIAISICIYMKLFRKKIVWTIHNIRNHEGDRLWLEYIFSRVLGVLADKVIVHSEFAVDVVHDYLKIPHRKIAVVRHGNYDAVVTSLPRSPIEGRKGGKRFLFFGQVRRYKGIVELIEAFEKLSADHNLRIEGRAMPDLEDVINAKIEHIENIQFKAGYISEQELEEALAWADFVVLPYKEVLTSGSVLFALTASRPVIVPDFPVMREYTSERCAIRYDPYKEGALEEALLLASTCDEEKINGYCKEARKMAENFSWDISAKKLSEIYSKLTET